MEKIWLKNYQEGVPENIGEYGFDSLATMFADTCEHFAERPAFENFGTTLSYKQLLQKSRDFAAYLQQEVGLKKGERVAIMLPNCLQYPITLFGVLLAGGAVVNVNPLYTAEELAAQLKDASPKVLVVLENFAKTVQQAMPEYTCQHVLVSRLGDLMPMVKGLAVNLISKYVKRLIPQWEMDHAAPYKEALEQGGRQVFRPVNLTEDDLAFLQYTGGTTGVAKGAMLTHGNMLANITQASAFIAPILTEGREVMITALPLYHIFSLTANCLTFMRFGALNILITNPRDLTQFIKQIKNAKFTAITGVNTLFNALLHHPDFAKCDFSALKLALGGGMAVQEAVAVAWQKLTKKPLLEAYGLTETSPAVTMNPMNLTQFNGSIGVPIPSTEVSIRDERGDPVDIGKAGELWVRGPQVMQGYWKKPEESKKVLTHDGWFKTGDVAIMGEDGYLRIVDRIKDMILVSGFNVYPNEIEAVLAKHPAIKEAGVIGVKSNSSGEQVKAFIVKTDNSLTEEGVIEFCRKHLTAYKVPKLIEFTSELPKTNVGKILRRELKDSQPQSA